MTQQKEFGRIYTPDYIVCSILDLAGYTNSNILNHHIMENSCGQGVFLVEIIKRYCNEYLLHSDNLTLLKLDLEKYIHAIEIDENEYIHCIERINKVAKMYGVYNIKWDIKCGNALLETEYNGKMDYVVGNPPYVRVHNLCENYNSIKNFSFAKNGMTDMYIVFYEIGIKMLNSTGILAYITPSSLFNSIAGKDLREYFYNTKKLKTVVDLKHFQPFAATTYTAIVVYDNSKTTDIVDYYNFSNLKPIFIERLSLNDIFIKGIFYFGKKEELKELKKIINTPMISTIEVKNGFATLCDNFFIGSFRFSKYIIPVIKASTGKWCSCIFPYEGGIAVSDDELKKDENLYNYFQDNKSNLEKRSLDKNTPWYAFGRSQGVQDVSKQKISINTLIRTKDDIKLFYCAQGVGVYGGLYIITDIPFHKIREMIICDDFISYVTKLSKYKSGGYYTFSSKDLKRYLCYKIREGMTTNEQHR